VVLVNQSSGVTITSSGVTITSLSTSSGGALAIQAATAMFAHVVSPHPGGLRVVAIQMGGDSIHLDVGGVPQSADIPEVQLKLETWKTSALDTTSNEAPRTC
jgi:hypothetical protein